MLYQNRVIWQIFESITRAKSSGQCPLSKYKKQQWDRERTKIEKHLHRQYTLKMKESGRTSLRNRKHVKKLLITKPHTTFPTADHQYQTIQQPQALKTNIEPNENPKKPPAVQSSSDIPSHTTTAYQNLRRSIRSRKLQVDILKNFNKNNTI